MAGVGRKRPSREVVESRHSPRSVGASLRLALCTDAAVQERVTLCTLRQLPYHCSVAGKPASESASATWGQENVYVLPSNHFAIATESALEGRVGSGTFRKIECRGFAVHIPLHHQCAT